MVSGLKVFSLGVIVDGYDIDKIKNSSTREKELSRLLKIYPVEHLSQLDGDLSETKKVKHSTKDLHGNTVSSNVIKSKTISAKWLNISNYNRSTPPIVNKGETVRIYRFEDTDYYYWDTIFLEEDLRQGEYIENRWYSVSEGWFRKIMDGLNNVFSFISPTKVKYPFSITLDADNGLYNLIIDKDNIIEFTEGGDELAILIRKSINVETKDVMVKIKSLDLTSEKINIEAETTNIKGEVVSRDEVTVKGTDVYKTLTDHEARISALEAKVG